MLPECCVCYLWCFLTRIVKHGDYSICYGKSIQNHVTLSTSKNIQTIFLYTVRYIEMIQVNLHWTYHLLIDRVTISLFFPFGIGVSYISYGTIQFLIVHKLQLCTSLFYNYETVTVWSRTQCRYIGEEVPSLIQRIVQTCISL